MLIYFKRPVLNNLSSVLIWQAGLVGRVGEWWQFVFVGAFVEQHDSSVKVNGICVRWSPV